MFFKTTHNGSRGLHTTIVEALCDSFLRFFNLSFWFFLGTDSPVFPIQSLLIEHFVQKLGP